MKMAAKAKLISKPDEKNHSQKNNLSYLAKAIISKAGVGIYVVQHGKFVYVSQLYQKLTGYSEAELIGTYSLGNIYPDDREMVREEAIKCLKEERFEPYEYRFINKKDEVMWVLETITPIVYKEERATLGSFMDITGRKKVEEKLRHEEQRFRALAEQSSDIIVLVNREGIITYENPAVERYLGLKAEERIGVSIFERIHPDDLKLSIDTFNTLSRDINAPDPHFEIRLRNRNGSWHTFELVGSKMIHENVVEYVILNLRDITERKQAESQREAALEALRQSEEKYRSILETIQEGYFEVDFAGNFTFFNDSLYRNLGYSKEELMGMNNRQYTDKEHSKKLFQTFNKVYNTGEPTERFDWQIIRKDGTKRYVESSVSLQKDSSGKPAGFRGIVRDVTERKQIEQQLNHIATHDTLTGLPNRMLFIDRLGVALAQSKRNRHKLAVMMLDLDNFKNVNDTLGHMVGDQLLKEVGYRLSGLLRQNDTVARLGGDEFIVLLSDLERMEDVIRVAEIILKAFKQLFVCGNHKLTSSTSIGIAVYPDDGNDIDSLLKNSDMAMYFVKMHGRNNYKFFADIDQS
jgi:diguanylate cyclase (GGDEF)-like protein/PAS domain S-box-containing protein